MDIISLKRTYTYEIYKADVKRMEQRYGTDLKICKAGKSLDERDILAFYAGTGSCTVLLTAGVHGRESNNTIVLMKMLEQFLQKPRKGYSLCVLPLVNPDGYTIALEGKKSIKNHKLYKIIGMSSAFAEEWKGNARGVDINRNFPSVHWKQTKEQRFPGSEPETRVLMKIMLERPFSLYLDIHSRGEEIYYYRQSMCQNYNENQRFLAEQMAEISGYSCVFPRRELDVETGGGNTVHFASEYGKIPSFTIETMKDESCFPLEVEAQEKIWEQIRELPFVV